MTRTPAPHPVLATLVAAAVALGLLDAPRAARAGAAPRPPVAGKELPGDAAGDVEARVTARLAAEYPPEEFAVVRDYVRARVHLDLAHYAKAADELAAFAAAHPEHAAACEALADAARLREALGEFGAALDLSRKRAAHCAAADTTEAAARAFHEAELLARKGDAKGAHAAYDAYVRTFGPSASLDDYFEARVVLARAVGRAAADPARLAAYAALRAEFDALDAKRVGDAAAAGTLGSRGRDAVAEAAFLATEPDFAAFLAVKLSAAAATDGKAMTAALPKWIADKQIRLMALSAAYDKIILYRSLPWTLAVRFRLGQLQESYAGGLHAVPTPPVSTFEVDVSTVPGGPKEKAAAALRLGDGDDRFVRLAAGGRAVLEHTWTAEDRAAFHKDLDATADYYATYAVEAYESCVRIARDKEWPNEWSTRCEERLHAVAPAKYPLLLEVVPPVARHDLDVVLLRPVLSGPAAP
ncbi:MAG TPA: hypothetical protein VG389_29585 [Myxococcota bacterium]|jgi:hypothetical protein|nr:hypothetical protein [Myxococcota bacterium]